MTRTDTQAVPEQFVGFFDDAATFPPGLAPLPKAVIDHVARRASWFNDAVGPAVLALKDLPKARAIASGLELRGQSIEVSAVVPAGDLQVALEIAEQMGPEIQVVAIELKTDSADEALWKPQIAEAAQVSHLPIYVELDAGQVTAGALEILSDSLLHLKYRTGGIKPELFPSPEQLAVVLLAAVTTGVKFKLTAGLHEAVRFTNATTGFTHHGFLNIAMAAGAARRGEGLQRIMALLSETDADPLVQLALTGDATWRESFSSFGTCSVAEPAESLERLGLFPGILTSAHPGQP